VQPTGAHPQLTWEFRLDEPSIRIASINLTGTPPAFDPAMQRVVQHLTGAPYNDPTVEDLLLAPLRDAGYIDAQLTHARCEIASATSGYAVRYIATVVPGEISHVATMAWQPTTIYASDAFAHDAKLHTGDLASRQALLATEQAIVDAYLRLGYLDAYVDAHPQADAAAHTVSYNLQAMPGEVYRIRTVSPINLSPDARTDFDRGWLLKPGEPYNPLYAAGFLTNNTALRNLAHYTASFQAAADPQTHLVDLTIKFVHAGGQ
jgi:outer membrane protein insertion porin family